MKSALLERLRAVLLGRLDREPEQALVRVVLGLVLGTYLLPGGLSAAAWAELKAHHYVYLGFNAAALALLFWTAVAVAASPLRRVLGLVLDAAAVTFCMWYLDEDGAALFLVYLWITFGNGVRYGPRYLMMALAASLAGFALVLATTPFWQRHLVFGIELACALIVLSLYVLGLVRRLFDALAQSQAANEAKRRFISVVSHEMRTPLNAIIGIADLMRETSLSREQADMLQTMRSASRAMLSLVEDVLDFSKIEAGKLVLEHADFDLHALVNSTCRFVATQAAAKGVEFIVSIMPEVPPSVRGDAHHLRQVLLNLVGNAVKFTDKGSITVHVSVQGETSTHVRLKFSVRDTGIGIAPEAQARIFDSFTQADQSTTRRFGGTGLGTTIAKHLVELMGGTIGLESAVGLGSTFWFELELAKQPEREGAGAGELAGARILLVGFPESEQRTLADALTRWAAAPVAVPTVDEGVQRLVADIGRARPYHSAIVYAGADARESARRFRSTAPEPVPPLVLAVPPQGETRRFEALAWGYRAVFQLPVDKRQLFHALHSLVASEEPADGVVRLHEYARRGTGRSLRVLAADDNETNRQVLGRILERAGHTVTLVANGDQALQALELGDYDLVLLDRNMPGRDGLQTLQAIRLLGRGRRRLPVAILSADVTLETRRECEAAGADGFFAKPIEASRLLDEVQRLCARGRTEPAQFPGVAPLRAAEAPPPEGPLPVIDQEMLRNLAELGSSPAFLEKLVAVFASDNAALLERIERALAARDLAEFRSHVHAMKGSAASMGAVRLARLCANLGALGDAEIRLRAGGLVSQLREEQAAARDELERRLRERNRTAG